MSLTPAELGAKITAKLSGLDRTLGLSITHASAQLVEAALDVDDRHRQIHGLVHGGVYTSIVETVGSIGAWIAAGQDDTAVVGLENHTSFVRAVRSGTLHAKAEAVHRGRSTQLWEVRIFDDEGKLAATGRLRSMVLKSAPLAEMVGTDSVSVEPNDETVPQTLSSGGVKDSVQ